MAALSSRRWPYPNDVAIDDVGLQIIGGVVAKKVRKLDNVSPTEQAYSSEPVYREREYVFRRPILGVGERIQQSNSSRHYYYALNGDARIGGLRRRGPLSTSVTPPTHGSVSHFVEALSAGIRKLFALSGQYVLVRNGDAGPDWGVSKDLGNGHEAIQAARFKDASGSPVDALYVADSTQQLWQYTGASDTGTWTALAGTIPAHNVAVVGEELWRAFDNKVSKCTGDPATAGNWAGAITVGDGSVPVSWLLPVGLTLFVVMQNGKLYSINTAGTDTALEVGVSVPPSATTGRGSAEWKAQGKGYLPLGDGFYDLTSGDVATLTPIGPERLLENDAEVRGRVQAATGHQNYFLYEGVYNPQNGNSYLWSLGAFLDTDDSGSVEWIGAQHGALVKWAGKEIRALFVSDRPGPNERLYAGFTDGSIAWVTLPRGTPDPVNDPNCLYSDQTAQFFWPSHHAMFQADNKSYHGFTAVGLPALDSLNYVQVAYRLGTSGVWTDLGANFNTSGQRVDITEQIASKVLEVRETLVGPLGGNTTPSVESVILHEKVHPSLRLDYAFQVDARDHAPRRDGATSLLTGEQTRDVLRQAADLPANATLALPDEVVEDFSVVDYQEALPARHARAGLQWAIDVVMTEYRTSTIYGIFRRLPPRTFRDLAGTTFKEMGTF